MKQLDLFSFALEDQIIDLKQGEELVIFRGKERLLVRKHEEYQGVCFYQSFSFSGYALYIDETSGMQILVSKIKKWLEGEATDGT